jgi:subtilisin-like proprotein convertase family protein
MRQVHPTMPPASIVGILRATGTPITDSRNGVTTPRLDVLAAVQFDPSVFFPFLGTAPQIPDGSGSASASVTISGFTASIAGIDVWVEIDHPDPQQLRVTLTGPDGTAVLLHDQTGEHEHPINAIYGRSDVPAQSLGVFGGKNPNGVWTLTVEDKVANSGLSHGKIRNFAIQLEPGQPTAAIPQNVVGRVLPESAHSQGSKFFLSDIHVYNPGNAPRDFSIFYVPAGRTGADASKATKTIGPGQVLELDDLVSNEFGFADSFGPIFATSSDPNFMISGRLYTNSPNGSFGHAVPGFATSQGLAMGGGTATANGLIKSGEFHSNVAFTEVSGNPVQVLVEVLDASGSVLGSTTITAGPNTTPILGDVITSLGLPAQDNFRVNFTVLSPTGRIIPFATYVDDITGDSIFQPAMNPAASPEDLILTQSAHLSGAHGDFFTTNVYVTNTDTAPVNLTVSLLPNRLTGTPNPPRTWTLAPGETLAKLDVLVSEFGLQDPSVAGLRIHPDHAARLVVTNNTLVPKFGGSSGYSVQAVPASTAVGGGKTLTAIGLSASPLATGSRCNFGFIEVAGQSAVVRVTAYNGADGSVIGTRDYPLSPNTLVQTSSTDLLGGTDATAVNFYLRYQVVSGSGRVLTYATVNDNTSGDGIYVPAE